MKDNLLENEVQRSNIDGAGKLYKLIFSEFIRLHF